MATAALCIFIAIVAVIILVTLWGISHLFGEFGSGRRGALFVGSVGLAAIVSVLAAFFPAFFGGLWWLSLLFSLVAGFTMFVLWLAHIVCAVEGDGESARWFGIISFFADLFCVVGLVVMMILL